MSDSKTLQGRGGRPEGYCHRQMLDAIRYLVAGGISWRAMPVDFLDWGRVSAFFHRRREHEMISDTTGCAVGYVSGRAVRRSLRRPSSTPSR
ncbi:transposase [Streptomyces sp. GESEQ-35]|uniref:transposase n=1 Tax=Streptomyces sp. GESEQ-35 TaxID=2812657 RepID=UPI001FF2CCCE|nr:transposase [Streptomyces sp. GESEQ-35]